MARRSSSPPPSVSSRLPLSAALLLALLGAWGCSRSEAAQESQGASKAPASARESAAATGSSSAQGAKAGAGAPQARASGAAVTAPFGSAVLGQATDATGEIRLLRGEELALHLRTTKSRGTLVNVWASWCGPCRDELPMLLGLSTSLAAQGIELVFVSVDEPESEQAALSFFRDKGGKAPIYVAEQPLGPFKEALSPRWRGMLPATFLFDARGALRYLWGGPVYDTELLPVVEGYLAGKNIDGESNFGLAPGQDSRH